MIPKITCPHCGGYGLVPTCYVCDGNGEVSLCTVFVTQQDILEFFCKQNKLLVDNVKVVDQKTKDQAKLNISNL